MEKHTEKQLSEDSGLKLSGMTNPNTQGHSGRRETGSLDELILMGQQEEEECLVKIRIDTKR